jgi:hypothetical protein
MTPDACIVGVNERERERGIVAQVIVSDPLKLSKFFKNVVVKVANSSACK